MATTLLLLGLLAVGLSVLGRRDPRLFDAPASGDDDSVPFE